MGSQDLLGTPGVARGRQKPVGKPFEKPFFLFDLENDPAETTNVIERFPDIAERLWRRLEAIRTSGRSR